MKPFVISQNVYTEDTLASNSLEAHRATIETSIPQNVAAWEACLK